MVKVPILELNYFKKSDILSSNTSEIEMYGDMHYVIHPNVMCDVIRTDIRDVICLIWTP